MAKHFGEAQWRAWFSKFEQQDITVAQFCDAIGVSVPSYYKWRRKLQVAEGHRETTPQFVSVVLSRPTLEIELPCGAKASVANDVESLRPVLQVLLELGAKP